ncbi:uncharacterized protein LOC116211098 [Punica granatum]|uniref:Uncharacterized protein LOC116211098 n=2 Tax=Punica granatum TaxID=22663 RepID=A0A6P8E096_PUNGR|nr:uncharacterized protein LOC116211098 [Punica granatum]PKI56007.1 hypothetical protein CRG98_023594 [Punica granatum]
MASSTIASTKNTVRSISLPSRPHPTNLMVEDELTKLKSWEASCSRASTPSSGSILSGLSGLEELYACLDEFLNTTSTRQVVSHNGHESSAIDEILDASVRVLDVCEAVRDIVGEVKEHARALTSAIRRRKWDVSVESHIVEYTGLRKKVRKDAKRLVTTLKLLDNKLTASSPPFMMLDQDPEFARAVRVLREVNSSTVAVFRSLVSFLWGPAMKPKQSGWRVISRLLVHKGTVGCEERQEEGVNELDCVDDSLKYLLLCKKGGEEVGKLTSQIVSKQFGNLEVCVGSIEDGLECLFRRLIRSRASLLNIISQ